mmetsp:Transcript_26606/g.83326  ORF Transcript_26606/g.83326 Transcript_26606/m.83326 type:complete len:341 (+) Transcript_26606:400-1422(+)
MRGESSDASTTAEKSTRGTSARVDLGTRSRESRTSASPTYRPVSSPRRLTRAKICCSLAVTCRIARRYAGWSRLGDRTGGSEKVRGSGDAVYAGGVRAPDGTEHSSVPVEVAQRAVDPDVPPLRHGGSLRDLDEVAALALRPLAGAHRVERDVAVPLGHRRLEEVWVEVDDRLQREVPRLPHPAHSVALARAHRARGVQQPRVRLRLAALERRVDQPVLQRLPLRRVHAVVRVVERLADLRVLASLARTSGRIAIRVARARGVVEVRGQRKGGVRLPPPHQRQRGRHRWRHALRARPSPSRRSVGLRDRARHEGCLGAAEWPRRRVRRRHGDTHRGRGDF